MTNPFFIVIMQVQHINRVTTSYFSKLFIPIETLSVVNEVGEQLQANKHYQSSKLVGNQSPTTRTAITIYYNFLRY